MDFGEVWFGSDAAVVEQAVTIPMFINELLHSPISVKFQVSLVVVSESCLEVLNAHAEGGSSQQRPTMTQQRHTSPFTWLAQPVSLVEAIGLPSVMAEMAGWDEPGLVLMEAACHHWFKG